MSFTQGVFLHYKHLNEIEKKVNVLPHQLLFTIKKSY